MDDSVERHFARNLPRLLLYLGVTATVATIALRAAVVVVASVLAFIVFVPMGLGSLSAGTYECITLAQRAVSVVTGGGDGSD